MDNKSLKSLLKALEKSEEDVRQGRVAPIEGMFERIKGSVHSCQEEANRDANRK